MQRNVQSFSPDTNVDPAKNTITFATPHGFTTGDAVVYFVDPTISTTKPRGTLTLSNASLDVQSTTTVSVLSDMTALITPGAVAHVTVNGTTTTATVLTAVYDSATDRTLVTLDAAVLVPGLVHEIVVDRRRHRLCAGRTSGRARERRLVLRLGPSTRRRSASP